jgi:hypothetical protein
MPETYVWRNIKYRNKIFIAQETAVCRNSHNSSQIPTLLDSWVTSTPSVKNESFSSYFRKNITRFNVDLLRMCQVFLSPVIF